MNFYFLVDLSIFHKCIASDSMHDAYSLHSVLLVLFIIAVR